MTDTLLLRKGLCRQTADKALRLIYPARCPVCDLPVKPFYADICPECLPALKPVTDPWCEKCGKKLETDTGICSDCGRVKHYFVRNRSVFVYEGISASIYRFKYLGRREYASLYADMTVRILGGYIYRAEPEMIVPVPLSAERELKRGYNQALDYAEGLSAITDIPLSAYALKRVKNTRPMKLLSPSERQNNLKNAFMADPNVVKSRCILLVDDIYTTGATLDACSKVLLEAGALKVYGVTLASGAGI